jgi:hypothetical protein
MLRLSHSKRTASVHAKIAQKCLCRIIFILCLTGLIIKIILFDSTTVSARYVLSKQISFTITTLPASN